ncbi:MAG: hypothetical protein DIU65_00465 [Proteobacteria bacterium]|nr:MAG: hypothetical protein DIU65_00465 [Pseudomonadota bacterium]
MELSAGGDGFLGIGANQTGLTASLDELTNQCGGERETSTTSAFAFIIVPPVFFFSLQAYLCAACWPARLKEGELWRAPCQKPRFPCRRPTATGGAGR